MNSEFVANATKALGQLSSQVDLGMTVAARVSSDSWVIISVERGNEPVASMAVNPWSDPILSNILWQVGFVQSTTTKEVSSATKKIGFPLKSRNGLALGALVVEDVEVLGDNESTIDLFICMMEMALDSERLAEASMKRAEKAEAEMVRDPLTSLYNRRGWEIQMQLEDDRCARYDRKATVFSIDLDGLKTVNDTLGHSAGDDLIMHASKILKEVTRNSDIVARLGGDEFAVMCPECGEEEAALFRDRLAASFGLAGVRASIGFATKRPSMTLVATYNIADAVMYQCKMKSKKVVG